MTEKRRLGRYRLEELLGQGGMAEVWRARDERLGRTVAVKVILAAHSRDPHFLERFQKEAQLVASLDHPNVLPIYDYGDEDGVPYIVMPYLEGGTLRDRMVGAPVPFAQAVSWIRQLGDALDAAHEAGILHRDVKPANVLIRKDDRLALADFGIAKMLEGSTGLTATGMVVGTPIYMAPEQAQGKPATPASDRYALAVLAYELVSGKPPFDGESALALMHQHVTSKAPLLSSTVHGLPTGLDPLFEAALAKEPERRPPTCRAFAGQLLAFVPTGSGLDLERTTAPWARTYETSPTVLEAVPARLRRSGSRGAAELTSDPTISTSPRPSRRTVFGAAAAVAGVGLLAGAWLLVPRPRPAGAPAAEAPAAPRPTVAPEPPVAPSPIPEVAAAAVPVGDVKVVEAPLRTAPPAAASVPEAVAPRAPSPPGAPEPVPSEAADDSGPEAGLRSAHGRIEKALRGERRPTRGDFEAAVRVARAATGGVQERPGLRALGFYAEGGLAYLDRKDVEAERLLLAAETAAGKAGAWDLRLVRAVSRRGGTGSDGWELAIAYGDARREAEALLAAALARKPGEPRALLGRAALRRLDGRGEEAIADATTVFACRPPGFLGAAAAELIADENASRERWEEAVRWYREAARPRAPGSGRAAWEAARILEERLGRPDEARELYAAACRAGNRRACGKSGEPAPRARLFPRRRSP